MTLQIKWKKLVEGVEIPKKAHPTDAGMDMRVIIAPEFVPQTTRPTDLSGICLITSRQSPL